MALFRQRPSLVPTCILTTAFERKKNTPAEGEVKGGQKEIPAAIDEAAAKRMAWSVGSSPRNNAELKAGNPGKEVGNLNPIPGNKNLGNSFPEKGAPQSFIYEAIYRRDNPKCTTGIIARIFASFSKSFQRSDKDGEVAVYSGVATQNVTDGITLLE